MAKNKMNNQRVSKFLSLILRHKPETIGVSVDQNGWVDLDELIEKMTAHGHPIQRHQIEEVVATNTKQRFKLDQINNRIRANQGHSIPVDVELEEKRPPQILYHGTATRYLDAIRKTGLRKMSRQHVHLSQDYNTAVKVGSRHGKPVILKIDCEQMLQDGIKFYLSENKVWLTDTVAVKYIKFE